MMRTSHRPGDDFDDALQDYLERRSLSPASGPSFSYIPPLTLQHSSKLHKTHLCGIGKATSRESIARAFVQYGRVDSIHIGHAHGSRTGSVWIHTRDFADTPDSRAAIINAIKQAGSPRAYILYPPQIPRPPGPITAAKAPKIVPQRNPTSIVIHAATVQLTRSSASEVGTSIQISGSSRPVEPISLIDLDEGDQQDACSVPPLSFTSSISSLSPSTPPPLIDFEPGEPFLRQPVAAGQEVSSLDNDLIDLRKGLAQLCELDIQRHRDAILGLLLMLPSKQRTQCLNSSDYLELKARLALAMLTTEI